MVTWAQLETLNLEEKKPDWFERVSKTILVVVAILGLTQEKTTWFPYVLAVTLVLLSLPFVSRQWKKWGMLRKQNRALSEFSSEYISLINRAKNFVESNNSQLSIVQFFNLSVPHDKLTLKGYNSHVCYLFQSILHHLHAKATKGFKRYLDFQESNELFTNVMDTFVTVYADEMIQELKRDNKVGLLERHNVNILKQMYVALNHFINDYNTFRGKLDAFWSAEPRPMYVRIPMETLN